MRLGLKRDRLGQPGDLASRLRRSAWSNVVLAPITLVTSAVGSVLIARALGPDDVAVVAGIASVATTVVVASDLGIARSLPKILADCNRRFGPAGIARVVVFARRFQLTLAAALVVVFLALEFSGILNLRPRLQLGVGFWPLVVARVLLSSLVNLAENESLASFKGYVANRLLAAQSILEVPIAVAVALAWRDPYLVVSVGLVAECFRYLALLRLGSYDIGEPLKAPPTKEPVLASALFREYRGFVGMMFAKLLFNRFVVGVPFVFWALAVFGGSLSDIGNAALAWAITTQLWTIADLPLVQLHAPLLAKLHSDGREQAFKQVHQMMLIITLFSSGLLAIITLGVGEELLARLYGSAFKSGVEWGITGAALGLFLNTFSLGNRVLQQRGHFRQQARALVAALFLLPLLIWFSVGVVRALPFALLLAVLGARAVFWLWTDLYVEAVVLDWSTLRVRIASGVALAIGAAVASMGRESLGPLGATLTGMSLFGAGLWFLGGVRPDIRRAIAFALPSRAEAG